MRHIQANNLLKPTRMRKSLKDEVSTGGLTGALDALSLL